MCFSSCNRLHDPGRWAPPLPSLHTAEKRPGWRLTLRSCNSSGEKGWWAQAAVSVKETEVTSPKKFGPAEERSMEGLCFPTRAQDRREIL